MDFKDFKQHVKYSWRFWVALIVLLLIVGNCISSAQEPETHNYSLKIDPKLATQGAYDYDDTPVADILFIASIKPKGKKYEVGLYVEYANLNPKFMNYGFIYSRRLNIYKDTFVFLPSIQAGIIWRDYPNYEDTKLYGTIGLGLTLRGYIGRRKSWGVVGSFNSDWRRDLNYYNDSKIINSGMVGLFFEIKKY